MLIRIMLPGQGGHKLNNDKAVTGLLHHRVQERGRTAHAETSSPGGSKQCLLG